MTTSAPDGILLGAPAATVALVASYFVWFGQVIAAGVSIVTTCGAPPPTPA